MALALLNWEEWNGFDVLVAGVQTRDPVRLSSNQSMHTPKQFALLLATVIAFVSLATSVRAAEAKTNATDVAKPATNAPTTIRILAGSPEPLKDETGVNWAAADGFEDGDMKDRPDTEIGNTKTPSVYRAERFGMSKFGYKVPNGKYTVNLHFAVTYEGITEAGQCVMTINVEGKELKDFDVWTKAGGPRRAYVESVPVTITDGKLDITFAQEATSSTLSAIEIIPAP